MYGTRILPSVLRTCPTPQLACKLYLQCHHHALDGVVHLLPTSQRNGRPVQKIKFDHHQKITVVQWCTTRCSESQPLPRFHQVRRTSAFRIFIFQNMSCLHVFNLSSYRLLKILRITHCTAKDARHPCKRLEKMLIRLKKYWYWEDKRRFEWLWLLGYFAIGSSENQVDLLPWNDLLHFHGKDIFTTNNNHVLPSLRLHSTWEHS